METVADALRELGEVTVECGLTQEIVEKVRDAQDKAPFDALVSHLPENRDARCAWGIMGRVMNKYSTYGPAFGLLRQIRELTEMPIIVYTGAGRENIPAFAMDYSRVDMVVDKSVDTVADAGELVSRVRYEWDRPPDVPEPFFIERSEDGAYLQMETVLCQRCGFDSHVCAHVLQIFKDLPGSIETVETDGSCGEEIPLNEGFGLMTLCAPCGSRLRIRLESTAPEAEAALQAAHELFCGKYL
jgi:hypothetical protein